MPFHLNIQMADDGVVILKDTIFSEEHQYNFGGAIDDVWQKLTDN